MRQALMVAQAAVAVGHRAAQECRPVDRERQGKAITEAAVAPRLRQEMVAAVAARGVQAATAYKQMEARVAVGLRPA